jgi:two-component system OmpR family response regulator
MINILMIEDDSDIAKLLSLVLLQHDINLTNFECPELGMSALNVQEYDLVILDLSLPGLDGTEVCKMIREKSQIPIIISTARSDIKDKTLCYNYGADDYIPKPYDTDELILRIKALLKRANTTQVSVKDEPKKIFTFDSEKLEIYKNDKFLHFTMAEYKILEYLLKKSGLPISRQEILMNIDSIKYESNIKSIDVIIGRIRQKIELNSKEPQYLLSIRGVGYKFINK